MNKFIKLISIVLSLVLLFCGCASNSSNEKPTITLNQDSASEYLTFSLHGGGGEPEYSSLYGAIAYHTVEAYGTIQGKSNCLYENVSIILKFTYKVTGLSSVEKESRDYYFVTDPIELDSNGCGTVDVSKNTDLQYWKFFEKEVECLGYEIVAATGTIITPTAIIKSN